MLSGAVFAAVLVCAQGTTPAPGPSAAKAQAQHLLREGTRLYRDGQYQEALTRFHQAYVLYPSPKLHFNVGQANRELQRPVEALNAFERFLEDPAGAPRATIDEARRSLTELRRQLGQIQLECPTPDLDVLIDGAQTGKTPLPAPLWAIPGAHVLALRGPRLAPFEETVQVRPGTTVTVTPTLRQIQLLPSPYVLGRHQTTSPGDRPAEPSLWSRMSGRWWFWAAVAAVAVGGGVTTAVLLSGGSDPPSNHLRLLPLPR